MSPDGRSVYVASAGSDSIAHFRATARRASSSATAACQQRGAPAAPTCPARRSTAPRAVAVSPDGRSVYVAVAIAAARSHISSATPRPARLRRLPGQRRRAGLRDLPGAPLDGAYGVAVSPDGRSVYVVSDGSGSIAHFFRALGDAPPPGSVTTPGTPVESPRRADRLRRQDADNAQARRQTDTRPRPAPDHASRTQTASRSGANSPARPQRRSPPIQAAPHQAQANDLPRRRQSQDHRQAETAHDAQPAAATQRQAHAAPASQATRPRRQRPHRHQDTLAAAPAQAQAHGRAERSTGRSRLFDTAAIAIVLSTPRSRALLLQRRAASDSPTRLADTFRVGGRVRKPTTAASTPARRLDPTRGLLGTPYSVVHRPRQRVMSSPRRSSVFARPLRPEPVQFRAVSSS